MRRRLDLAAGLIGGPPVILLDEPTTGLDPRSRQELWTVLDELRRAGTTVLLTTQYLDEADRLAQEIAVVDRGRIAAQGTAAELKAQIGSSVLSVRLADAGDVGAATAALADLAAAEPPSFESEATTLRVTVADPSASAAAVRRLDARRVPTLAVELLEPSLDGVFLTLTGHPTDDTPAKGAA